MRASGGFQTSVALIGIGLYIFSIGYVATNAVAFFRARGDFVYEYEYLRKAMKDDPDNALLISMQDEKASMAEAAYGIAKDALIRSAGIGIVAFLCGVWCTVTARKIQANQSNEIPEEADQPR
jgi:hypothetical protein